MFDRIGLSGSIVLIERAELFLHRTIESPERAIAVLSTAHALGYPRRAMAIPARTRSVVLATLLALLLSVALGTSACTAILGGFDFDGAPVGTGGAGGAATTTTTTTTGTGGAPMATCSDGKKNGGETDVDCGGDGCPKCADEQGCSNGSDCTSKVCLGGTCISPSCDDKLQNGDETDVDCGGATCGKCGVDKGCAADGDCKGGSCGADMKCAATCTDGVKDGDETDVDCGGAGCPKCDVTKGCATGPDCETGVCEGGACVSYYAWARSFGDQNPQTPSGLAVDTAGSVVITGGTQGTVDFGGGGLMSAGGSDVFVAKLDKDGGHTWSKVFGDDKNQQAFSVATDSAQNVILLGTYDGTINFGGQTFITVTGSPPLQSTHTGLFLAKLDTTGQHVWSNAYLNSLSGNSTFRLTSQSLVAGKDTYGDVCMAGGFQNSVNLGGAALTSSGSNDVFVACYGKGGNHVWSSAFGDGSSQFATSIACSADYGCGSVVVGGWFTGTIDFGGGVLTQSSSKGDVFVASLSSGGSHYWSKSFATNDYYDVAAGTGISVALDSGGNVYLAGHQTAATDFGGGPVSGNFYLVKLDASGNHLWSKGLDIGEITVGGTQINIVVDSNDGVLISNKFYNSANFGGDTLSISGIPPVGMYVAKFDASGNHVWSRAFGSGAGDSVLSTGLGSYGAKVGFVSGVFNGQIDFGGPSPLVSVGQDIFLAKLLLP